METIKKEIQFKGKVISEFKEKVSKTDKNTLDSFMRTTDNFEYGEFVNLYKSGVYEIHCIATNKFYIGASNNVGKRLQKHFSELRFNRHPNTRLQQDYNTFGQSSFEWHILEETLNIYEREIYYQKDRVLDLLYNDKITGHWKKESLCHNSASKDSHKTQEYRDKMSTLLSRNKVARIDLITKELLEVFESVQSIELEYPDYKVNVIRGVCNGTKKSYKGYGWMYLDKDIPLESYIK